MAKAGKADFRIKAGVSYDLWVNEENQITHIGIFNKFRRLAIHQVPMSQRQRNALQDLVNKEVARIAAQKEQEQAAAVAAIAQ